MPVGFEGDPQDPNPDDPYRGGQLASSDYGAAPDVSTGGDLAGLLGPRRRGFPRLINEMNLPDAEAPKSGRPRPPKPGGGPPPPGGLANFGGIRPNTFDGATFGLDKLPILRRKRGIAGVTPGAPGKSDTVPAMLTPGEPVASNQTGDMSLREAILMLNNMGAGGQAPQGFAGGGMAMEPEDDYGMESGVHPESPALQFIRLLLALDSGQVEGFAQGGVAGLFGGGFGRSRFGQGAFGRPPAQPGGAVGAPAPAPQGGFGYQRDAEGQVTNYNPADPWGGYAANQNAYGLGTLFRGVGQAGQAGAYDPRGNQQLVNQQIEAAQGTKDALVRRQMTAADLGGLDPAQRAVAKLQALRETGRGVQDISAQVRAGAADRAQSFNEQMLRDLYAGAQQYNLGEQQGRNQRMAINQQNRAGGGFGGFAGQLAGAALGGWAGGGFAKPWQSKPKQPGSN